MAAKRKKQQTPDEKHYRAVHMAQMGVAKRGPKTLGEQLNRGRWARFEKQADELFPGLRDRDPNDFAARVQAMNKAHMAKCTAASLKARREREESCSWCCEERGDERGASGSERMCPKHQKQWDRQFAQMKQRRGVTPERAAEIDRLARQAYRQSA